MLRFLKLLLLCAFAQPVFAACHVYTPTGSGTGADWTTPGNISTATFVNGDTYYLAGGSGGSYTHSGQDTSPIFNMNVANVTIKAATVADHCTATGWVAATFAVDGGAGQAVLASAGVTAVVITANNAVIDGNPGLTDTSASWNNPLKACGGTQCGIKFDFSTTNAYQNAHFIWAIQVTASGLSGIKLNATQFEGCGQTCATAGIGSVDAFYANVTPLTSTTISHNFWHNTPGCFMDTRGDTGTTLSYNYFYYIYSDANHHGCIWAFNGDTNDVFAYNAVRDTQGSSPIDNLNSGVVKTSSNMQIYGNVFWQSNGNTNSVNGNGDGIIGCINSNVCQNWKVYNNTVVNFSYGGGVGGKSFIFFGDTGSGSSVTAYNNLLYNNSDTAVQNCSAGVTCTFDYNYYSGTTHTAETHEQTTSVNPLTNWPAYTVAGFQLVSDTNAWTSLASPYNIDATGSTRTSSRGALQFSGVAGPQVGLSPSSLAFGNVVNGTTSGNQTITLCNGSWAGAVCNAAGASLTITSITLTGTNAAQFAIATNNCGASLAAGSTCTVLVNFTPNAVASFSANLTYTTNAASSPDNAPLSGSGVAAPGANGIATPGIPFGMARGVTKALECTMPCTVTFSCSACTVGSKAIGLVTVQ